jgi:hypothetical protein
MKTLIPAEIDWIEVPKKSPSTHFCDAYRHTQAVCYLQDIW